VTTDAVTGQRQVLRITQLRSHPARMLVVFGAPTAFLVTGLRTWLPQAGRTAEPTDASPDCTVGMARGCPVGSPANVTVRVW